VCRGRFFFLSSIENGGEGRGEEAIFIRFPSFRLSPHFPPCGTGREGKNAFSVFLAEHN
jgi:hypothetical protein